MRFQLDAFTLFQYLPDRVTVTDRDGVILYVNPAFEEMTGYSAAEAVGSKPSIVKSGYHPPQFYQELWETILAGRPFRAEVMNRKKSGELYYEDQLIVPILDEQEQPVLFISFSRDITHRKALDARVRFLVDHDPLTGQLNRRGLLSWSERVFREARAAGRPVSVLFIDFDNFRTINEGYGHQLGDRVLITASQRIQACIGQDDACGRWGGDEFVVVLPGTSPGSAEVTARTIQSRLEEPAEVHPAVPTVYLRASIGVAAFPDDGQSVEEVIRLAERAMFAAKERAQGVRRVDRPSTLERTRLLVDLPNALEQGQIELHYQPTLDLGDQPAGHPLRGADALAPPAVRNDPARRVHRAGRRDPGHHRHRPLGSPKAVDDILSLIENHLAYDIAVNLSARTPGEGSIVGLVEEIAAASPEALTRLVVEVTESSLVRMDTARHSLESLRRLGVRVALDDFGTGYSSMAYLEEIPADIIKIDRRFTSGIGVRRGSEAIIRAIIALCREFGCRALAEGIETQDQLEWLTAAGCHEGQGYWIGMPSSKKDLGWASGSREKERGRKAPLPAPKRTVL